MSLAQIVKSKLYLRPMPNADAIQSMCENPEVTRLKIVSRLFQDRKLMCDA